MGSGGITPVAIVSGPPGPRDEVVRRLLQDPRHRRTAVLAEDGQGLGTALARRIDGSLESPMAGCACCRVATDVVRRLRELHFERHLGQVAFDRVLVASGALGDPVSLLASLAEPTLAGLRYAPGAVVAVLDAATALEHLDSHEAALRQAAVADVHVVLGAAAAPASPLQERLRSLNPWARLLRPGSGRGDAAGILDAGLYAGGELSPDGGDWLGEGAAREAGAAPGAGTHSAYAAFEWRSEEPAPWPRVERALAQVVAAEGPRLLRMKGLVAASGEPGARAVHAVRHTLYPSARLARRPGGFRGTRIAFAGRGLDEARIAAILAPLTKAS